MPPTYDSLVAKVIVHAEDREACIARSIRALGEIEVEGIKTTRDLLLDMVREARFRSGLYTTAYIEEAAADLPHLGSA